MKVSRSANFTGHNKPGATTISRTNYSPSIGRKPSSRSDVKVLYVDNEFSNEEIAESKSNNDAGKDLIHVEKDIEQLLCSLSHIKAFIGRRAEISDQASIDQIRGSTPQEPCLCPNQSTIHLGQILEESLYEEPLDIPSFSAPPHEHYVVKEGHVANIAFALESSDRFECVLSRQSFANGDDDNGDIVWTICGDESNNFTHPNQSDFKVVFNRANPDAKSCSLNCLIFDVKPSYTGMYRVEAINIKGSSVTTPFVLEVIDAYYNEIINVEDSEDNTYGRPMFTNCLIYSGDGPASSSYEVHLDLWPCLPIPSLFLFKDGLRLDHSTSSMARFPTYPSIMEYATSNDQVKGGGPNQTSSIQNIMRTSVLLNSTHAPQFSGMFLCLAENRVGKGLTMFELDPAYNNRGKEPSLQLMRLTQPGALASRQIPALNSDQWWETEPLELEVGVKESVITRLLVVADQPMESLGEALNKEMPSSIDPNFQSLEDHDDIASYNDENRNTPIKVDHQRYTYKRPTPSEHNKDSSTTTEDEINSSSTSNSYDEWTCSNPTSVAYRAPVKRNYYFYSSSRVEKSEISPRDVPLDSPYHPSDDQWNRRCESTGYTDIGQVNEFEVNDSDSTTSSLPMISETSNHRHGQSGIRAGTPEPSKSLTMHTFERNNSEEDNNGVDEVIKIYKRDAKNVIFMSCNTTRGTSPKINSPVRTNTPEQSQACKGQAGSTTPTSASSKFNKARSLFEAKPSAAGPTENSPGVPSKVHTRAQHNSVKWRQPPLIPVSCSSTSTALLHKYGPRSSKPSSPPRMVDRSVVDSHDTKRTGTRHHDSKGDSPDNCTRLDGSFSPLHSSASHHSDPLPNNNRPLSARIRYKNIGSSSPWPRRRFTTEIETVPSCDSRSETPVQHCRVIQHSSAADLSRDQHS